jgi:hypothetical protein
VSAIEEKDMAIRRRPATTVNYPAGAGCGADRFSCGFAVDRSN